MENTDRQSALKKLSAKILELDGQIDRPFWLDLGEDRTYGKTDV